MSKTTKWLDFSEYDLTLVLSRDLSGKKQHTLLFAGKGLKSEANRASLMAMGFSRDMRFPNKQYWTRSIVGFSLGMLRKDFPRSVIVDWTVEQISPAAKFDLEQKRKPGASNEPAAVAGTSSPRSADVDANRGVNDAGTRSDGVLVEDGPRADVRSEPSDDVVPVRSGKADGVSRQPTGSSEPSSAVAGEAISPEEPVAGDSDALGQSVVVQSGAVVQPGDVAERREHEPDSAERGAVAEQPAVSTARARGRKNKELEPPEPDYSEAEYQAVGELYRTGPAGNLVGDDAISASIADTASAGAAVEVADDSAEKFYIDPDTQSLTREAFNRRDYDEAFRIYQQGQGLAGLTQDAFIDALASASGGEIAAQRLNAEQRRELHRLGLRDNIIEDFAIRYVGADASLGSAFDYATQNDALIASALKRRIQGDNNLAGQLLEFGFTQRTQGLDDLDEELDHLFESDGAQIVVSIGRQSIQLTGRHKGDDSQLFVMQDRLESSPEEQGAQLLSYVAQFWPHLVPNGVQVSAPSASTNNPTQTADESEPTEAIEQVAVADASEATVAEAVEPSAPGETQAEVTEPVSNLDGALDAMKAVVADPEGIPEFPAGWVVMNAARPLFGHSVVNGRFLDGVHYAGIDPRDSLAQMYVTENIKLNASVIVSATPDQQVQMALVENKYRDQYLAEFTPAELIHQLTPQIANLQHMPFAEMKALLEIAKSNMLGAAQGVTSSGASATETSTPASVVEPETQPVAVADVAPVMTAATAGAEREEQKPVVFVEEDEVPVGHAINRAWRGATLEHMLDGQERTPTTTAIFDALAKQESGEPFGDFGMRLLAAFRGWGVEGDSLRVDNRQERDNLNGGKIARSLGMTSGEFQRTYLENRLESYYSPPQLVSSIWKGVLRAGVNVGGKFLDAGCGAGAFFTGAPNTVQSHATLIGVECDPITTRLARAVAPDATILQSKYEQAVLARDFDAVIGNVPFGSSKIHDSNYPDAHHIHDYFILRSLDQLKPGGVMSIITSAGSLDKVDPKVREEMLSRADLIGAVRLPREAFSHLKASVDTDILFLQRRPEGTQPSFDYTESVRVTLDPETGRLFEDPEGESNLNRYYLENPDNLLGSYQMVSTAFGPKAALVNERLAAMAVPERFDSLERLVDLRVEEFVPEGIAQKSDWVRQDQKKAKKEFAREDWSQFERIEQQLGNFVGDNIIDETGRIIEIVDIADRFDNDGIRIGFEHVVAETKFSGKRRIEVMHAYINLRDVSRELIAAQLNGSDEVLADAQLRAKQAYGEFTKKFGPVNESKNVRIFGDDAGSAEVCALEIWDDEHEKVLATADTFEKRVIGAELIANITTPEDAYYHSLDIKGRIDFPFMAEVLGMDEESIQQKLIGDLVFLNPVTHEYEAQHQYLSGNVVRKLAEAEQAVATMPELQVNVDKLKEAQPAIVPFEDISLRLGVGWIPPRDIEAFTSELFGITLTARDFTVTYTPEISSWSVEVSNSFKSTHATRRATINGTKDLSFERLLEMQLNAQKPTHYNELADGRKVVDDERTMASRVKQEEIEEAFRGWVSRDVDRMRRYTEMYNTNCNTIALPKVDGSRLTFPGLVSTWTPRPHQKDQVAMALMGYNCMAAHCVGAGKTWEMVAIAMKLKQVGMCNKPAIAVPNHMLGQITREAKQMYPSARILQVTADDLTGPARQRFLARVRNNDWDLVVMTHGMLNRIQAPLAIQTAGYQASIRALAAKIEDAQGRVQRQLEAQLKSQQSRLADVVKMFEDQERKMGVLTIDSLGIDMINVDETHLYKNWAINSNMDVLGVTRGGSQRAENYNMLTAFMRDLHGRSFGMNSFTGTPIANTMCELFVHGMIQRPEIFKDQGIHDFDEWAKRFGDVVTALEPLPEGGGFRVNERFARFVNLPEMIKLFRTFCDVKNASDLNLPVPSVKLEIVAVPQSDWQVDFMKHLAGRAIKIRSGRVKPHEDNMLSISSAGRKAALDMQLVNPLIPPEASMKINAVAENIHLLWEKHDHIKATQLVFMDMGTPKKDGTFSTYQKLRERLVELGMPNKDIAFVHEAKNDAEKDALFAKVRSGEVRVLIGSTEKMGVGTNVQDRLCALHNVDCPWRPADIAQRRGRIERQGNKLFDEVTEYRYTTKDSFDLFMWGGNQRKATFSEQALSDPTQVGREVSEETDLGYAEVMAVTTGNPKIREKVETDDKVNKMERKRRAFQSDIYGKAIEAQKLSQRISNCAKLIEIEKKIASALPSASGRKVVEVIGGVSKMGLDESATFMRATEAGEAILARQPMAELRVMKFNEQYEPLGIQVGKIKLVLEVNQFTKQSFMRGVLNGELLPLKFGFSKSAQVMGGFAREFYDTQYRINQHEHELAKATASYELVKDAKLDAEWPQEAEFKALKELQRELDRWFSSQKFEDQTGGDPFADRIAALELANEQAMKLLELERVIEASGDTQMLNEEFRFESSLAPANEQIQDDGGSAVVRTGMRMG
ncbi:helicase-related protein [Pseudomonas sp. UMAB-40]|uniref:helicase-related protein n=1 Tax=Pseudomonas sp. UMAB-40 TaxID=1365407 RepID=UPI001C58AC8B|nr:helicase-related protein [Pseudomonas sp. UMAB-40]